MSSCYISSQRWNKWVLGFSFFSSIRSFSQCLSITLLQSQNFLFLSFTDEFSCSFPLLLGMGQSTAAGPWDRSGEKYHSPSPPPPSLPPTCLGLLVLIILAVRSWIRVWHLNSQSLHTSKQTCLYIDIFVCLFVLNGPWANPRGCWFINLDFCGLAAIASLQIHYSSLEKQEHISYE